MNIDATRLLSYIERIEHVTEEIKSLQNDVKEIYDEAKSANFDVKALKTLIKLRAMDEHERDTQEFVLDAYKAALGMASPSNR